MLHRKRHAHWLLRCAEPPLIGVNYSSTLATSLAEVALPPIARAALQEQLSLAPGSLTNGSVQVVRMRARRMEAEVIVLDPVQRRMRSAYVRLIGPSELQALVHVLTLLESWEPAAKRQARGGG